jgi:hypothetical protein
MCAFLQCDRGDLPSSPGHEPAKPVGARAFALVDPLDERTDELGVNPPDLVAQPRKRSRPLVRSTASFDRDRANRLIRQERQQALSGQLLSQDRLSAGVLTVQEEHARGRPMPIVWVPLIAHPARGPSSLLHGLHAKADSDPHHTKHLQVCCETPAFRARNTHCAAMRIRHNITSLPSGTRSTTVDRDVSVHLFLQIFGEPVAPLRQR